jgi:hypothetical protein
VLLASTMIASASVQASAQEAGGKVLFWAGRWHFVRSVDAGASSNVRKCWAVCSVDRRVFVRH